MMRSESTRALGHPRETKLTLGAAACDICGAVLVSGHELIPILLKYKALSVTVTACYQCLLEKRVSDGLRVVSKDRDRRRKPDPRRYSRGGIAGGGLYRRRTHRGDAEPALPHLCA